MSQRLTGMRAALSGQHKYGGMAVDLLLTKQEAAQVTSTKNALLADILFEGTASANSRLPVKQQVQRQVIHKSMEPSTEARPRSARAPGDQPAEDFTTRR